MSDQTAAHQIAELKVSGHTMALDPGLYCVFSAPGSPPPDATTGLPVVRISAAPGQDSSHVEIVGLDVHGWIRPDSATLVRVVQSRANVLVTVYQATHSVAEPPALQAIRISPEPAAAAAPQAKPEARAQPQTQPEPAQVASPVQVVAHIYSRGDVGGQIGEWMGEPGTKRWIEGFGLAPTGIVPMTDIEYQAVLGRGWLSPWSEGGQFCGSRGMSLPILGLRVRLKGASAATKGIRLEATFVDGSTSGPVGAGEPCEAESLSALEAFRLVIEDADDVPAQATGRTKTAAAKPAASQPATDKPVTNKPAPKAKASVAKPAPAPVSTPAPTPAPTKTKAKPAAPAPVKPASPKARGARTPAPTRRR